MQGTKREAKGEMGEIILFLQVVRHFSATKNVSSNICLLREIYLRITPQKSFQMKRDRISAWKVEIISLDDLVIASLPGKRAMKEK